jgi:CBS domain-containing protein
MKCRDIMRRPLQTLHIGATVQAVASKMKEANVGLIPICDAHGAAVGVITDRDIAIRVVAVGLSPTTSCESIMTRDIVSCAPEEDLETVARIMSSRRKSRVLVTEEGRLVGIVSLSDLAATNSALAALALHDVAAREIVDVSGAAQPHGP